MKSNRKHHRTSAASSGKKVIHRSQSFGLSLSKSWSRTLFKVPALALILVVLILSPLLYLRLKSPTPIEAWFDHTWQYRQKLTFTNSGSEITSERKVKFEINTSTLISSGKLQSNCSDIRFTDLNGQLLDYFIDTQQGDCNTSATHFYVKLSKILAGDQSVFVYYGNSTASPVQKTDFFADTTLGQGLVGYWPMDDNVTGDGQTILDYAGTHNGTTSDVNVSGMDCTISGKVGRACDFDGVDDNYTIPDTTSIAGTSAHTLVAWVKTTESGSSSNPLVTKWSTYYQMSYASGKATARIVPDDHPTTAATTITGTSNIDDNNWHLIVQRWDAGDLDIIVDGVSENSATNTRQNIKDNTDVISIGGYENPSCLSGGTCNYSEAIMDELRIYNRALTDAEVSQIYNSGNG